MRLEIKGSKKLKVVHFFFHRQWAVTHLRLGVIFTKTCAYPPIFCIPLQARQECQVYKSTGCAVMVG